MGGKNTRNESNPKRWGFRIGAFLVIAAIAFLIERSYLPLPQNQRINEWKGNISKYETVFAKQTDLAKYVEFTRNQIGSFDITVNQAQKEAEIEEYISSVKSDSDRPVRELRFDYDDNAFKILLFHYEARKQLGAAQRNYTKVSQQLEDCRANIPEGSLSRAPY